MESSNREEAARCIGIARAAVESGERSRALKFLGIAQRLKPDDPEVIDLIAKLGSEESSSATTSSTKNGEYESEVKSNSSTGGATPAAASSDPSPEQIQIVRRVNQTADYYEILGLKKDCSEEDVRKAYRKLSLKVHPDKNKAKGAEEAFKSVSRAFQCLSNAELRESYDRHGPETSDLQQRGVRRRRRTQGGGEFYDEFFEDRFDPDEIFQAFFGGQGRQFQRHFHQQQHQQFNVRTPQGQAVNMSGIIHLALIFLVIVLTSFPFNSQPSYFSLERESPYVHQLRTSNRGVPYYVKTAAFGEENPVGSKVRSQVEAQVERDYRDVLLHNCRVELNLRAWGKISETPNCKKLESFQQVY